MDTNGCSAHSGVLKQAYLSDTPISPMTNTVPPKETHLLRNPTPTMSEEIDATSGTVMVNGFNLKKLRRRKIPALRRTIGVVFQDFRLIPTMTVYENVAFVLRVIDAPAKYIRSRVPYVISLVGLSDKAKSYPTELSGGEQQRVALARALVNDPQLIIADEPTGNIDPALSYEIVELLKGINECGTTILMVTHEHDLVRYFGGRIININKGQIAFDEVIGGSNESK